MILDSANAIATSLSFDRILLSIYMDYILALRSKYWKPYERFMHVDIEYSGILHVFLRQTRHFLVLFAQVGDISMAIRNWKCLDKWCLETRILTQKKLTYVA